MKRGRKTSQTRKVKNMLTKEDIINRNAELRMQNPQYDALMSMNRPEKTHQIFIFNDDFYFEFWKRHEWEFTIAASPETFAFCEYNRLAFQLARYADLINLNSKNLLEFVSRVKCEVERLASGLDEFVLSGS